MLDWIHSLLPVDSLGLKAELGGILMSFLQTICPQFCFFCWPDLPQIKICTEREEGQSVKCVSLGNNTQCTNNTLAWVKTCLVSTVVVLFSRYRIPWHRDCNIEQFMRTLFSFFTDICWSKYSLVSFLALTEALYSSNKYCGPLLAPFLTLPPFC